MRDQTCNSDSAGVSRPGRFPGRVSDTPEDPNAMEHVVRHLARTPVQYGLGLSIACPCDDRTPQCPFAALAGLSPLQQLRSLQATQPPQLAEWLQHHTGCLTTRDTRENGHLLHAPPSPYVLLLAEDDVQTRFSLELALKRAGYWVISTDCAEAAAEQFERLVREGRRQAVDLLVTDLNMPGKSGSELIAELDALGQHLPVVVITAYGDKEVERALQQRGRITVLHKPFHPSELLHAVLTTLKKYGPGNPNKEEA